MLLLWYSVYQHPNDLNHDDDGNDDANLQGAAAAISCGFVLTSPILRRVDEDGAVVVVIAVVVVC